MKFILVFYFFLISKLNCATDVVTDQSTSACGKPGHSKLSSYTPVKRIYHTNEIVDYTCENSDMVLIGSAQRACINGRWTKKIPKCGEN